MYTKYNSVVVCLLLVLAGCSVGKVVVDSSPAKMPEWVDNSKVSWEEKDTIFFRTSQTLRGSTRPSACLQMAKLDMQENLITEIQSSLRGSIEEASSSMDENAEIVMSKVRSTNFTGQIQGLRSTETYWERYTIGKEDQLSLTCYVLGAISKTDYTASKRAILQKIIAIEPRLKEAIMKKQEAFIQGNNVEEK